MQLFDLRLWPGFQAAGGNIQHPAWVDQVVIDTRRIASKNALFVALPGRYHDGHSFVAGSSACYALVKKDYQPPEGESYPTLLRVEDTLLAMQVIASLYRHQLQTTIIAVTGSAGKTMVKDLLYALLAQEISVIASPESFNSQIGVAMSLLQIEAKHQIAVIEAGISEPGDMHRLIQMIAPDHAILTNINPMRLADMQNPDILIEEKLSLLRAVPQQGWVLLPSLYYDRLAKQKIYAWDKPGNDLPHSQALSGLSTLQPARYRVEFPDGSHFISHIPGMHAYLLEHINIAIKAAYLLGISKQAIERSLLHYPFYLMRVERWKSRQGVTIINERYCSDTSSVIAALRPLQKENKYKRKLFLFGGVRDIVQLNNAECQGIAQAILAADIAVLIVLEALAMQLMPFLNKLKPIEVITYPEQEEALPTLAANVVEGDLVLIKGAIKYTQEEVEQVLDQAICDNKLIINLAAIESNLHTLRQNLPAKIRIMAMVKAVGYGTDSLSLGQFLEMCGIDIVGVAHVDEALELKHAQVTQDVFVIHMTEDKTQLVLQYDLQVGISNMSQLHALQEMAKRKAKRAKVHLHIDTGMGRLGCRPEQALALAQWIEASPYLILEGVMTHFACADQKEQDLFTQQQMHTFRQVIADLKAHGIQPPWIHAANSSAAMRFSFPECNMVRIGLGMFGLAAGKPLRSALTLMSRLVGINEMRLGETVSYGRTYAICAEGQRIGILPLGYFDGLHTHYSNQGYAIIRGIKAPFVGRICMDFMHIDLSQVPDAEIGDPVLIFGQDQTGHSVDPHQLALQGGTHVYQLITCLGPRIRRLFIYDEGI